MNYNPSPKSEFVKSNDNVAAHKRLVEDPQMSWSLHVALLEMSRRLCNGAPADNMGGCAAAHLRMLGAQDLIEVFLNLAETEQAAPLRDDLNLPGNVAKMPTKGRN